MNDTSTHIQSTTSMHKTDNQSKTLDIFWCKEITTNQATYASWGSKDGIWVGSLAALEGEEGETEEGDCVAVFTGEEEDLREWEEDDFDVVEEEMEGEDEEEDE